MKRTGLRGLLTLCLACCLGALPALAEVKEVRISMGFGLNYLPMYIMQHEGLLEKQARAAGLDDIKIDWRILDGGNVVNDAMLAGAVDIAGIGATGFLLLWSKAKGGASETIGLCGIAGGNNLLNTRNPEVKSLRDLSEKDRIALPGVKTSHNAILLQMAAAREFGDANYAKLDPLTVGLPYPEALAAMLSGKTEINAHFASAPFSLIEADSPAIHKILDSADLTGRVVTIITFTTRAFGMANPKLVSAFVAAVDEAAAMIERDKAGATRIYLDMARVKIAERDVMRVLNDPATVNSATPAGMMLFAGFMHRVGLIRTRPDRWQDLFVPEIGDRPGS